ncbi:MAG: type II toxin-antitoxin system RelB/DinJ family antitoxin [Candidatus Aureabacteria bacterium]|nr:type II toxin-antitoxin system RelB/DinJ family antitoxin [Candidatus Auribacterota bacterium]
MEGFEVNRTATVRARVEPNLKADVEKLLQRLGVTTTEAITMFYSQIRLRRGLPFPVEVPNATTRKTFEATDRGEDISTYDSLDEMFEALDKC